MARKIEVSGVPRRVVAEGVSARRVDHAVVERAFGEGIAARVEAGAGLDLWALKRTLRNMLRSSGGRPGFADAPSQVKIPKVADDWKRLEAIARAMRDLPFKPSPTQVAASVLHLALQNLSDDEIKRSLTRS